MLLLVHKPINIPVISDQPSIDFNATPPAVNCAAAYIARKNTDSTAAILASGAPVLLDTKDDKERKFLSLPSFCIYLYNQIQATNCPIVETTAIHIAE